MGNLREGGHLEDLSVDERIILKWILRIGMGTWNGLMWLRTWTGGELEYLLACKELLCSIEVLTDDGLLRADMYVCEYKSCKECCDW